jgi:hypothetical protein
MLFPAWDRTQDVAFSQLLACGAFVVSANFSAEAQHVLSPITVTSKAGQLMRLRKPWAEAPQSEVRVNEARTGKRVQVEWDSRPTAEDVLTFQTRAGQSYNLALATPHDAD